MLPRSPDCDGADDRAVGEEEGRWRLNRITALTPDEEFWAEAMAIERMHGADALAWARGRIAALALAGEAEGIERFQQIANRLRALEGREGAGRV